MAIEEATNAVTAFITARQKLVRIASTETGVGGLVDLTAADFRGKEMDGILLRSVDLTSADLRVASLKHADFSSSTLNHTRLDHANLEYANLTGTDMVGANLTGANLHNVQIDERTNLNRVILDLKAFDSAPIAFQQAWIQANGTHVRRLYTQSTTPNEPERS